MADLVNMTKVLKQGAESKIYVQPLFGREVIVKERFAKKYRNPELDGHLTKERMKSECRNIVRCKQAGIRTPAIYFVDFDRREIYMEYYHDSVTVKEYIQNIQSLTNASNEPNSQLHQLAKAIGSVIGQMHANNIIHGDLTTSNMLLVNHNSEKMGDLTLIDFGLSFSEASTEDKGVDLYVLERALLSTHENTEELFKKLLQAYSKTCGKNAKEVLDKLNEVRSRGRKRTMVG